MQAQSPRSKRRLSRRGLAVVELAVCMPILALILLATMETCAMLQMQQNLAVTAYEGSRIGIMPGVTASSIQTQCEMLLDDRNITGYEITMDPNDPSTMSVGDTLTLAIEADCASNSLFGGWYYDGKTVTESVAMRAE